jgi:hypothetical protein
MKDYMQEADRRSSWLDWQPKSPNITRTPEREPSKPTEPSQIEGREVKRVYFEDTNQIWFQDTESRLWHYRVTEKEFTELIPREFDPATPLPQEFLEDLGTLIGLIFLNLMEQKASIQQKEEKHE